MHTVQKSMYICKRIKIMYWNKYLYTKIYRNTTQRTESENSANVLELIKGQTCMVYAYNRILISHKNGRKHSYMWLHGWALVMLGQVKEVKLKRPLIVWCYQFEKYKLGEHKKTKKEINRFQGLGRERWKDNC